MEEEKFHSIWRIVMEYGILTGSTLLLIVGVYFFKFPNHFSFGGVSGLAVVLSAVFPLSASTINMLVKLSIKFEVVAVIACNLCRE